MNQGPHLNIQGTTFMGLGCGGLVDRISCRLVLEGTLWGQGIWEKWEHSALGSERPPYSACEAFSSCAWGREGSLADKPPTFIMVPDTDTESCSLSRKKVPHLWGKEALSAGPARVYLGKRGARNSQSQARRELAAALVWVLLEPLFMFP